MLLILPGPSGWFIAITVADRSAGKESSAMATTAWSISADVLTVLPLPSPITW